MQLHFKYSVDPQMDVETCTMFYCWREKHIKPRKSNGKRNRKESKLYWFQFQFQLLHRILPTNNYLHKIGKFNSPLCYFCQQTLNTVKHTFAEYFVVKEILGIERWLLELFKLQTSFDKYTLLFGKYENSSIHR